MSDSGKAVFLSYASQDAEAAKRICDALRAAGVEVWFDQSELRGGDAWDAMIRKRIKECALFVPIITPNTNARAEGYFRLEWKLAVDRSHLMADDAPFLFPIVLGDVTDATARVPDKFREVQWTRLRLDETPGELAARVARLLSTGSLVGGVLHPDSSKPSGRKAPPTGHAGRWQWWMIFPILGTIMGLMFAAMPLWKAFNRPPRPPAAAISDSKSQISNPAPATPVSAARRLAERGFALSVDSFDSTQDDFAVAEDLLKRALALDPDDGQIWAYAAQLNFMFRNRGFDFAPERIAAGRQQAERAVRLAPDLPEVVFAVALSHRYTNNTTAAYIEMLRRVLELNPMHGRALLFLGSELTRNETTTTEGLALLGRARENPKWAPLVDYFEFLRNFTRRKFVSAEEAIRRSQDARPSANSAAAIAVQQLTWQGNLEAAARQLAELPPALLTAPRVVWATAELHLVRRDPERALRTLDRLPDEFLSSSWYTGPKAYLVGRAHALAGREAAARIDWEKALVVIEQKLKAEPGDAVLHRSRGEILACLGRAEEALAEARTVAEINRGQTTGWSLSEVTIYAALGRADLALPLLERQLEMAAGWPLTAKLLQTDSRWDKLRGDPRFQQLCAEPPIQAAAPAAKVTDKSIAVLPFANMSEDKDATAFFADGVHEDVLTSLVGIRDLRVVSRTSVMDYRGTTKKIPEIGRELHVAYVLEGSVRRAGNKVRVTGQLIKAATDEHVWAKSFDRDLTDIFAIQAELAQTIATELDAALSPREQKLLADRPTTNLAAYDLYLKAREISAPGARVGREDVARRVTLAEGAVALDPKFAQAWAELAEAHVGMFSSSLDTTPARLTKARAALDRARALAPDSPIMLRAVGVYYMLGELDGAKAIEQFERILTIQPNDVDCLAQLSVAQRLIGRWPDAIRTIRTRMKLEPGNVEHARQLVMLLWAVRRYDEARAELAQLKGDTDEKEQWMAMLTSHATGSRAALDDFYARLEARSPDSPLLLLEKAKRALARGDYAEYGRLQAQRMGLGTFDRELMVTILQAWAMKRSGDAAEARQRLGDWPASLRARLELEPDNTLWLRGLAATAAILGNHDEALRCINHAADLMPFEKDSQRAATIREIRAEIYADMGDKERAVEQLAELLRHPSAFLKVLGLANDPRFAKLRGDPGFEAMLRDPKNNAPIF